MKKEVQEFIANHLKEPIHKTALKLAKLNHLPKNFILNQLNGRKKASAKFPFLDQDEHFQFPDSRALAQSSSEQTARYKSKLIQKKTIVDLTGGMGIDTYFFSLSHPLVYYVECNPELFKLTVKNFERLNADNITSVCETAEEFLSHSQIAFDACYLDPDRRSDGQRFFKIADCKPDISKIVPALLNKEKVVLVKLSPILDIAEGLRNLPNCKEVHVVAVNNDCKELLFLCEPGFKADTKINTVNFTKKGEESFSFSQPEELEGEISYSLPLKYLYEPNSAILKAGAFKSIALFYQLKKLEVNSHLYTSNTLVEDFPGKIIEIDQLSVPKKGLVKRANIVSRNFSKSVEAIKSKYKIKEGGESFLYATTLENRKKVFILGRRI